MVSSYRLNYILKLAVISFRIYMSILWIILRRYMLIHFVRFGFLDIYNDVTKIKVLWFLYIAIFTNNLVIYLQVWFWWAFLLNIEMYYESKLLCMRDVVIESYSVF